MRRWAIAGVVALAALNFIVQLGSSSLFIDEGLSWNASRGAFAVVWDGVTTTEISPPLHYYGLWAWIGAFGDAEWVMRLPSAVAGVLLTFVVYRLGSLVFDERAGLLAAGITALSPLALTYAQQTRAYVFAMLLAAVAVLAAVEAERATSDRARAAWLAACAGACVVGFWTHYTVGLVAAPVLVWVCSRQTVPMRARALVAGTVVASWLAAAPLLSDQLSNGLQSGIADVAKLTGSNLVRAIGTPFDGRVQELNVWVAVGAGLLVISLIVCLAKRRDRPSTVLVLAAATVPVLAVIGATAVSDDVLLTRYTAVTVPFMAIVLAGAATQLPRPAGAALGVAALVCALAGSVLSHRPEGFFPDVRAAYDEIDTRYRPGDVIAVSGYIGRSPVPEYYRRRRLPQGPGALSPDDPAGFEAAVKARTRFWLVSDVPVSRAEVRQGLAAVGYKLLSVRRLEGNSDLQVILAAPRT